ncbi:MAG: MaoC/PaaZ C-terminal domain-containing protein [Deltaproteobacteria bacterium]|nr:MaoC/PaaZ C-terminal domain-containing protein [Deltaproteobacteria bacterium]
MALNEKVIGKKYSVPPVEISAHESIYYALAYGDDNDAYFDNRREGGIIAPPMYAVKYASGPVVEIIMDQEVGLNFMMVVHYSQEFEWLKPVKPNDSIKTEGVIKKIEIKEKGSILGWETISTNQNGEIVLKANWEFFDRSAGSGIPEEKKEEEAQVHDILWTQAVKVKNGQTFIYAEPSGDYNPIHADDAFAKQVGLPGIILQGLCTMAFAHKAVTDNLTGPYRNPLLVKKLKVRFARPLLPGQTITYQAYKIGTEAGGTKYGIIARNDEGKDVLRDCWCIIG